MRKSCGKREGEKKCARFSDEKENSKTAFCSADSNQW
jgi:hypothetical protein